MKIIFVSKPFSTQKYIFSSLCIIFQVTDSVVQRLVRGSHFHATRIDAKAASEVPSSNPELGHHSIAERHSYLNGLNKNVLPTFLGR